MERTPARLEVNPCYLSLKKRLDTTVLRNYLKSRTAFVYCKNLGNFYVKAIMNEKHQVIPVFMSEIMN